MTYKEKHVNRKQACDTLCAMHDSDRLLLEDTSSMREVVVPKGLK